MICKLQRVRSVQKIRRYSHPVSMTINSTGIQKHRLTPSGHRWNVRNTIYAWVSFETKITIALRECVSFKKTLLLNCSIRISRLVRLDLYLLSHIFCGLIVNWLSSNFSAHKL